MTRRVFLEVWAQELDKIGCAKFAAMIRAGKLDQVDECALSAMERTADGDHLPPKVVPFPLHKRG